MRKLPANQKAARNRLSSSAIASIAAAKDSAMARLTHTKNNALLIDLLP